MEFEQRSHVYKVNAFTRDGKGGNLAGVVLHADGLTDDEKLSIAREVNASETAFEMPSAEATRIVEFFTREGPIPFCGHATVAMWGTLFNKGKIKEGEHTQELEKGLLRVTVLPSGKVIMDQSLPLYKQTIETKEVADVLSISPDSIGATGMLPQVVHTGLNDLIIPIRSREELFKVEFDDEHITLFQLQHDLDSLHLFTFDTIEEKALTNSRNTDPKDSIHEESATGSAHGALICYLFHYGKLNNHHLENGIVCEQGDSMGQPSRIDGFIDVEKDTIIRVRVGGYSSYTSTQE